MMECPPSSKKLSCGCILSIIGGSIFNQMSRMLRAVGDHEESCVSMGSFAVDVYRLRLPPVAAAIWAVSGNGKAGLSTLPFGFKGIRDNGTTTEKWYYYKQEL